MTYILPETFKGKGETNKFTYRQIKRNKNTAIYSQEDKEGLIVAYEVIKVKEQKGASVLMPDGSKIEFLPKEIYPNSKKWGDSAWTFTTRDLAEEKFKALTNAI